MNEIDLTFVDNPSVDSLNTVSDHSDHKVFINGKSNELSLSGQWKFIFLPCFNNDVFTYLNTNFNIENLNNINVPGHFEFQGYGNPHYVNQQYPWEGRENVEIGHAPKNNPIGIYFKDIAFNEGITSKVTLKIEGFETALYLFINGEFVGYSEKNFTNTEFDITDKIIKGVNRIALMVFKYSKGSWFLDQDMWRLSGIFRDVKLLVSPFTHIFDIDNKSLLCENLKDGLLNIKINVQGDTTNTKLIYRISNEGEVLVSNEAPLAGNEFIIDEQIFNVKPWSAEEPNLYRLEVSLIKNGEEIEYTTSNFGFRNIKIIDGVILINGKRLIIKGVNRHEFYPTSGRAIDKKIIEDDLKLLKSNNVNAIRTSHYPNNEYFYELCDKLGFYVIDEMPIETHGTWAVVGNQKAPKRKDILPGDNENFDNFVLSKAKSMYERDKNHPSIIFWSLGNESFGGKVLKHCSNYLRNIDPTRLVHYEGCFQDKKYLDISDVTSEMYSTPESIKKHFKKYGDRVKPFILCEFEHAMGNSLGNFDEYMDLIDEFKSFQGGFIWDFADQGILDKENNIFKYGGDFYDRPNDNAFCANGVFLSDREETPKTSVMKYYYQDLSFEYLGNVIRIFNKNLFIDTTKYYFQFDVLQNGEVTSTSCFELNLGPQTFFDLDVNKVDFDNDKEVIFRLSYKYKEDCAYAQKDDEIGFFETFVNFTHDSINNNFIEKTGEKLTLVKARYNFGVYGKDFSYIFTGCNGSIGGLSSLNIKGTEFIEDVPKFTFFRPVSDNEANVFRQFNSRYIGYSKTQSFIPLKSSMKVSKYNGESIKISYKYFLVDAPRVRILNLIYEVFNSGDIKVKGTFNRHLLDPEFSQFGITFKVPYLVDEFSYYGFGPYDSYPDRYENLKFGNYVSNPKNEFIKYIKPQECGNHFSTRKLLVKGNNGVLLGFYPINKPFSFKCLPYSAFEIDNANHQDELPKAKYTYIDICSKVRGCGGDNSWFDPTHRQYRLIKKGKYTVEFLIKKEK